MADFDETAVPGFVSATDAHREAAPEPESGWHGDPDLDDEDEGATDLEERLDIALRAAGL